MKSDLKIKLRKLGNFLLFVLGQCVVVFAGVYLWFTLGDSVYKFVDLWQFSDLLYIPDLLTVLGQGLLILVTVFFGIVGAVILLFEIVVLAVGFANALRFDDGKLKIRLRKLRTFLLFVVVQCIVILSGVYLWFTLGDSIHKFVDLWQFGDLLYIPDLLSVVGQGLLILATVFFGIVGAAILLFEIGALVLDLFRVVRSENKKEALQRFSRFYKAIIFG